MGKIYIEKLGKEVNGRLATKAEIEVVAEIVRNKNLELEPCRCGDDFCDIEGYLWVCNQNDYGVCQWYVTTTRCNP